MGLKSDIQPATDDNQTLDLQERRSIDPNMDMAQSVLDLRQPKRTEKQDDDNNFFFEYLPATAMHVPAVPLEQIKDSVVDAVRTALSYAKRHPRYVVAALLTVAAIILFTLSSATHRKIIKTRPEAPAAATTSAQTPDPATNTQPVSNNAPEPAAEATPAPTASSPIRTTNGASTATTTETPNQQPASQPTSQEPANSTPNNTPPSNSPSLICTPELLIIPATCL